MPNPNDLSSYEFQGNPYSAMLGGGMGGAQAQPQPQATPQGGGMQSAMQQVMAQQGGGMAQQMPEDQLQAGQTGDSARELVGAINSLENFIKKTTNRDAIATARQIVLLLARLMHTDQEEQMNKLGGGEMPQQ